MKLNAACWLCFKGNVDLHVCWSLSWVAMLLLYLLFLKLDTDPPELTPRCRIQRCYYISLVSIFSYTHSLVSLLSSLFLQITSVHFLLCRPCSSSSSPLIPLRSQVCSGTRPGCWCRKLCLCDLQASFHWGKACLETPPQVSRTGFNWIGKEARVSVNWTSWPVLCCIYLICLSCLLFTIWRRLLENQ